MKYLLPLILLCGCSTFVPVKRTFPQAPQELMAKCSALIPLQEEVKLSEVAKTVSDNYALYHECSVKTDAWQEWYLEQKKIFNKVK